VVLASSHEDEKSWTGDPYSIFTACLLEAMAGKGARRADGYARILDVIAYLFEEVPKRAPAPQHPLLNKAEKLSANFPICFYAGGAKSPPGFHLQPEEPRPLPGFLNLRKRRRMQTRLETLESEYEIREQKLKALRAALAKEAGVAVRFQLEKEILEEETWLADLDEQMEQIETVLGK
jgi:hypothetical protein